MTAKGSPFQDDTEAPHMAGAATNPVDAICKK
jgi:hypothetical protein